MREAFTTLGLVLGIGASWARLALAPPTGRPPIRSLLFFDGHGAPLFLDVAASFVEIEGYRGTFHNKWDTLYSTYRHDGRRRWPAPLETARTLRRLQRRTPRL